MPASFAKKASALTYLGIVPFILCTMAILAGFEPAKAADILRAYGAVIAAFIAGIHWGIGMQDSQHRNTWLLVTSNVISLLAWGALLMSQVMSALVTLALLLASLLCIDNKLYKLNQIDIWFIKLRWRATLVVVILLVSSAVMLWVYGA